MFCAKSREIVCEEIVVGEMPQKSVQETSLSQGQRSILRCVQQWFSKCSLPHM